MSISFKPFGYFSGDFKTEVVTSEEEWARVWETTNKTLAPKIDFEKDQLVLLHARINALWYAIIVSKVTNNDGILEVDCLETTACFDKAFLCMKGATNTLFTIDRSIAVKEVKLQIKHKASLAKFDPELQELKTQADLLQSQIDQVETQISENRKELSKSFNSSKDVKDALRKKLAELREQAETLHSQYSELMKKHNTLHQSVVETLRGPNLKETV